MIRVSNRFPTLIIYIMQLSNICAMYIFVPIAIFRNTESLVTEIVEEAKILLGCADLRNDNYKCSWQVFLAPRTIFGTKLWKEFMRVMMTCAPSAKSDFAPKGRWEEYKDEMYNGSTPFSETLEAQVLAKLFLLIVFNDVTLIQRLFRLEKAVEMQVKLVDLIKISVIKNERKVLPIYRFKFSLLFLPKSFTVLSDIFLYTVFFTGLDFYLLLFLLSLRRRSALPSTLARRKSFSKPSKK